MKWRYYPTLKAYWLMSNIQMNREAFHYTECVFLWSINFIPTTSPQRSIYGSTWKKRIQVQVGTCSLHYGGKGAITEGLIPIWSSLNTVIVSLSLGVLCGKNDTFLILPSSTTRCAIQQKQVWCIMATRTDQVTVDDKLSMKSKKLSVDLWQWIVSSTNLGEGTEKCLLLWRFQWHIGFHHPEMEGVPNQQDSFNC